MIRRVLLIAEGRPRRVLSLAEQIERHGGDARICGIIYRIPEPHRPDVVARIHDTVRSLGFEGARLMLSFIHGRWPLGTQTRGSPQDVLSRKCRDTGWDLCVAEDIGTQEVLEFAEKTNADLSVLAGPESVPVGLVALSKQGAIQGKRYSVDCHESETVLRDNIGSSAIAIRVKVLRIADGYNDTPLATVDLFRQPLDTPLSLEVKTNLILRDLLVQSVAELARHPEEVAVAQVNSWIQEMLPSSFTEPETPRAHCSVDQPPPSRVRSRWKLCVYSLSMLSPFVLFRNWLRRWRKQHPVVFLNGHLISDRHHRMTLSTDAFLREVHFLQRHYRIVSLSEASKLLESGSVSEPTVVLTFDDGYEDNFVTLRAVSEELGVPIVMFVSTEPITEHREFTHDLERGLTGFPALTWSQIRYWSANGTEFHSHTCSHFDCGSMDQEVLEREIVGSKHVLETRSGKPVTSLAFPFGKPENMSTPALAIAAKTYDHFLSDYGGENFPGDFENHKHLLRKDLQANIWESELELQGVFEIAKSAKRLARISSTRSGSTRRGATDRANASDAHQVGN